MGLQYFLTLKPLWLFTHIYVQKNNFVFLMVYQNLQGISDCIGSYADVLEEEWGISQQQSFIKSMVILTYWSIILKCF